MYVFIIFLLYSLLYHTCIICNVLSGINQYHHCRRERPHICHRHHRPCSRRRHNYHHRPHSHRPHRHRPHHHHRRRRRPSHLKQRK